MDRKVLKSLTRLVTFGMIVGCTEQDLPVAPLSIPARLTIVPPSAQAVDLPVGALNNPANTVSLPTFTYPVIVELRLEGTILTTSRPDTYLHAYNGALDGSGIYTESVFSQCGANVTFRFSVSGTRAIGPCLYNPIPQTAWTDTSLVEGTGSLTRNYGIPQFTEDCQYNPCHSYFGTQTGYVTPLPATLQLAASASQVDSGQTVVFTASASPSSIKGLPVPVKVLSWRWIPSGGGTGQTIACSIPSNPCSAIIRESGAIELTALANGAEQVVTAPVLVNGAQVKLTPDSSRIKFSVLCCNPVRNEPSRVDVAVSVIRTNGVPIPNQTVTLTVTPTEGSAGHIHVGGKPAGSIASSVNTGPTGVIKTQYVAPLVSGPVNFTGSSAGATSGTATIDIGQWNLQLLADGVHYDLTGEIEGKHTDNHWGKAYHIQKIQEFAELYFEQFQESPTFNDSSLPFGGLYDVGAQYWSPPHQSHSEGRSTDFKTIGLSQEQLDWVRSAWGRWRKYGAYLGDETVIRVQGQPNRPNTTNPHFHLTIGPTT